MSAPALPGLHALPGVQAERAAGLLRLAALAKIKNGVLAPQWLDQTHFWYKRDGEAGAEYVIVDADTGDVRVAFDHVSVAAALGQSSGSEVLAGSLPLKTVALTAEGVVSTFARADKTFEWLSATGTLREAASRPALPDGARLGPDGRLALFVRDHELWLHDTTGGAERRLTDGGGPDHGFAVTTDLVHFGRVQRNRQGFLPPPSEISWSPDGRRLIASFADQRHVEPYPFIEQVPVDGSFRPKRHELRIPLTGERPPSFDFHIIDVETGAHRPIDLPPAARPEYLHDLIRFWWAKDGARAIVFARDQDATTLWLIEIDAASGATRTIIGDDTMPLMVFGEGGGSPPAVAVLDASNAFVWMSQLGGWRHLFLHDLRTGAVIRQLTSGDWLVRELLHVDEPGRTVIFTATGREPGNPYHRYIYKVGLDDGVVALLTPEPGDHSLSTPVPQFGVTANGLSPDGRFVVYGVSTVADPGDFRLRRTGDGELITVLETVDASMLFEAGYRPPEEFAAKAADGVSEVHGLIYRPSDYDPKHRYPVIDMQYGSPLVAITPRRFMDAAANVIGFTNCAALAELGFVVVVVDARGTPGRRDAFSRARPGYLAHMGLDDHIAFVRAVAAADPGLDLDRVGISGISFGGWTTFRAMLRYPDVFKVGVSGAGPGSFQSMWTAPPLVLPHGPMLYGDSRARPTPTAIPDAFKDIDNPSQADRLDGRLLIVIGEHDENVPPASTLQFYDALIRRDKDVDLIYVPNGTHGGIYGAHIIRRECNFFLEHLAGMRLPKGVTMASPLG